MPLRICDQREMGSLQPYISWNDIDSDEEDVEQEAMKKNQVKGGCAEAEEDENQGANSKPLVMEEKEEKKHDANCGPEEKCEGKKNKDEDNEKDKEKEKEKEDDNEAEKEEEEVVK